MGSLFEPDVQQTTTQQDIPPWARDLIQEDMGYRRGIINRPYQAYGGEQGMTFNDMQNSAFGTANMFGNMAPGAFANSYNALTDTTGAQMMGDTYGRMGSFLDRWGDQGAAQAGTVLATRPQDVEGGSFLGMDRDAYTNQYVDAVSNDVLSNITRQADMQRTAQGARAIGQNAFGGSRTAVESAVLDSEAMRNYGQMDNQLRAQAFDAASGLMGQDLNRGLQANLANQNAGLQTSLNNSRIGSQVNMFNAGQSNQANSQMAGLLNSMGNLGQGMANTSLLQGQALQNFGQAGMGAQLGAGNQIQQGDLYNQGLGRQLFEEARDWGMNNYLASGGVSPSGQIGGSTTQDVFGSSGMEDLASMAMTAASIYMMFGSDVRLKEDIKFEGVKNGHNWYSWQWNEEAAKLGLEGRSEGVMAHEMPEDYVEEIDGYDHVNYAKVLS